MTLDKTYRPRFPGAVLLTLLIAALLNLLPLGDWWLVLKPDWVMLTLIHWAVVLREKVSILLAFLAGLLTDAYVGSLLGHHAFAYVLVTYIAVRVCNYMLAEQPLQQLVSFFGVNALFLLIGYLALGNALFKQFGLWSLLPLITNCLIWPIFREFLKYFHVERARQ